MPRRHNDGAGDDDDDDDDGLTTVGIVRRVGNFVGSWAMVAVEDVRDKALVNKLLKLASQTMETQESNRLKLQLLKVSRDRPRSASCALVGDTPWSLVVTNGTTECTS